MGFLRRFLSVGLGIAAGAFAYKLLKDYNDDGHIDGEYVELPPEQSKSEEEAVQAAPCAAPEAAPNPNPVELGAAEKPLTGDGRLDATRIASPEDFGDWDDLGCKG